MAIMKQISSLKYLFEGLALISDNSSHLGYVISGSYV